MSASHTKKKHNSKKKPTSNRYLKFIGSTLAIICTVIGTVILVLDYLESRSSWVISLKELHIVRYNNEKLPEARFSFKLENSSSDRHSISLETVEFVAVERTYTYRSPASKKSMEGHTISNLDVRESSLFFDTILAIPYNQETMKLRFSFSSEGDTILLPVDDQNVVKCIFMQEPRFDPFSLFERQTKVITTAYFNDKGTDYGLYVANQSHPFLSFINILTDSSALSISDEVFFPTYGGVCMFNLPGYPPWFADLKPSDVFGELNEYQISETIRENIDFDFSRTDEFVVAIFSDNAIQDTLSDKKILPLQVILTANPEGERVSSLRDSLSTRGFRVIIEEGSLAFIMTKLLEYNDGICPLESAKPDSIILVVQHMNEALSHESAIVLELGYESDEFAADIRNTINESGLGEHYTFTVPTKRRYHPISTMVLTSTPRIIVLDVQDTLSIDSTKADTTRTLYKLMISGPKDKFR